MSGTLGLILKNLTILPHLVITTRRCPASQSFFLWEPWDLSWLNNLYLFMSSDKWLNSTLLHPFLTWIFCTRILRTSSPWYSSWVRVLILQHLCWTLPDPRESLMKSSCPFHWVKDKVSKHHASSIRQWKMAHGSYSRTAIWPNLGCLNLNKKFLALVTERTQCPRTSDYSWHRCLQVTSQSLFFRILWSLPLSLLVVWRQTWLVAMITTLNLILKNVQQRISSLFGENFFSTLHSSTLASKREGSSVL